MDGLTDGRTDIVIGFASSTQRRRPNKYIETHFSEFCIFLKSEDDFRHRKLRSYSMKSARVTMGVSDAIFCRSQVRAVTSLAWLWAAEQVCCHATRSPSPRRRVGRPLACLTRSARPGRPATYDRALARQSSAARGGGGDGTAVAAWRSWSHGASVLRRCSRSSFVKAPDLPPTEPRRHHSHARISRLSVHISPLPYPHPVPPLSLFLYTFAWQVFSRDNAVADIYRLLLLQ